MFWSFLLIDTERRRGKSLKVTDYVSGKDQVRLCFLNPYSQFSPLYDMDQVLGVVWSLLAHVTLESMTFSSFRVTESIHIY